MRLCFWKRKPRPLLWTQEQAKAFYASREWSDARYDAFKKSDGRCAVCGKGRNDRHEDGTPVKLNCDHIKPLRRYPHLRSTPRNLRICCDLCNKGKGNRDEKPWP